MFVQDEGRVEARGHRLRHRRLRAQPLATELAKRFNRCMRALLPIQWPRGRYRFPIVEERDEIAYSIRYRCSQTPSNARRPPAPETTLPSVDNLRRRKGRAAPAWEAYRRKDSAVL